MDKKEQDETGKFVSDVIDGKNSAAMKKLEDLLKKKIARRISKTLSEK